MGGRIKREHCWTLLYHQSIFINLCKYLYADYIERKTRKVCLYLLNLEVIIQQDNGMFDQGVEQNLNREGCENNGLLTPFDCWHINHPLSRPTGNHWLHWSPCETSLERSSSQAFSSMELLRSLQDLGVQGSQLWAPLSKAKVSRTDSGLYSNNRVGTQRVSLGGQMDY